MSEHDEQEVEGGKRRMPDNLRRFLIKMQGGKMYLPAAFRVVWFRDELGDDWGIHTQLVEGGHQAGFATVHAEIVNPAGRVVASGHKTEAKADFPAGWVEKAESGAIARALALLGFGTQFTPELDDDGYRPADSPQPVRPQPNRAPAQGMAQAERMVAAHAPTRQEASKAAVGAFAPVGGGSNGGPRVNNEPGPCPGCHAPQGKMHGSNCDVI